MSSDTPDLRSLDRDFQAWIDERADAHAHYKQEPHDFGEKVKQLRALQAELFDAGWALYGWPEELGGKGGAMLHRGLVIDVLERNGYPPRHIFEHLDILPPALVRFARPALLEKVFLPTLRGDVVWCQGFSEPTAGSDLASLRTRAEKVDGGYRLDGHKIWTSWAPFATHCLVLARTGDADSRHRGITAFVIETSAPGVQPGVIVQSNGSPELAEVFFDGAVVPEEWRVGEEGEGWAVAMHILSGERGSFTWLRQCEMLPRLEQLARSEGADQWPDRLGESYMRLVALRCRSREVIEILASGRETGPESSVTKVLVADTEQHFYDTARTILDGGMDLGTADDIDFWQEHYLASRAASIYGGARQIQLNVIAKLMISRGVSVSSRTGEEAEELEALRASVDEAIEQSASGREALDGLDWWSFAGSAEGPDGSFGREAFSAWFEGQGARLASSPALSGVRGAPAAEALGVRPDEIAWGLHESGGEVLALGLDAQTRRVVLERDGGLVAFEVDGSNAQASGAFDAGIVQRVAVDSASASPVSVDAAADDRARSLARLGAACEILGASRKLLTMAIDHTNEREQFGKPLSKLQAIQHMISESQIEVSTLEALCRAGLEEWCAGGGETLSRITKAQAGRDGRSVAQRALQCFGGIGFTEEHDHHLYSRRIHTLDIALGSFAELCRGLGRQLVQTGQAERCVQVWRPAEDA